MNEYWMFLYLEVVDSVICMAKFLRAAHGHPSPLPTELLTFSELDVVGCLLSFQVFPYMEVVGSLICIHGKLPTCITWAAHSVAHLQLMNSKGDISRVFCMGIHGFIMINAPL